MRRTLPLALLVSFVALKLAGAVSPAHAEPDPGITESASADGSKTLAFDPASVRLSPESPEARCLVALRRGERAQARRVVLEALPSAVEPSLGRLRWLYAKASDDKSVTHEMLTALARSDHPLAHRAQLLLAAKARAHTPVRAEPPAPEDPLAHADGLLAARRWRDAAKAYAALAKRFSKDPGYFCRAQLGEARALLIGRKYPESLAPAERAAKCEDPEIAAAGRFNAGRTLLRMGEPARAVVHYDTLARELPGHRLADDALYAAALASEDLGDLEGARTRLRMIVEEHPGGDMRATARFALVWHARREGRHAIALEELALLLAEGTGEDSEDMFGRAEYWRARTLLDLGQVEDAKLAFVQLVRDKPLCYYAQQALARLRELDAQGAAELVQELRDEGAGEKLVWPLRPELSRPEFARAVELLRVGELPNALEELRAGGFLGASVEDELYFLAASLFHEVGAHIEASTLMRRRAYTIMSRVPRGQARSLWRVAFPAAFSPLIEEVAREAMVPPSFVRAVAREESSFDPNAVSSADAYGLIQLIEPTARAHARALGLPSDAASLKRPEINLRIGAAFMRNLFSRYETNPALVPAAYNAGPNAADRWLRERGSMSLDEWIESIPYNETRRYTRRVLQSYGVYTWLDEGKLPELTSGLPAR